MSVHKMYKAFAIWMCQCCRNDTFHLIFNISLCTSHLIKVENFTSTYFVFFPIIGFIFLSFFPFYQNGPRQQKCQENQRNLSALLHYSVCTRNVGDMLRLPATNTELKPTHSRKDSLSESHKSSVTPHTPPKAHTLACMSVWIVKIGVCLTFRAN